MTIPQRSTSALVANCTPIFASATQLGIKNSLSFRSLAEYRSSLGLSVNLAQDLLHAPAA